MSVSSGCVSQRLSVLTKPVLDAILLLRVYVQFYDFCPVNNVLKLVLQCSLNVM